MQNKKQIILSIIAIVTLAILVIGASFAYFAAQGNTSAQTSATVKTYTVDVFSFETGDPISFSLNQENFASGKGNQTGSTFAKAILTANNKTNTATEHYNMYLNHFYFYYNPLLFLLFHYLLIQFLSLHNNSKKSPLLFIFAFFSANSPKK